MDTLDFEQFLQLEDVNDTGFSKETNQRMQADLAAIKAEKEATPIFEDEETASDVEDDGSEFDFSFLDEDNPVWEDEIEEAAEPDNEEDHEESDSVEVDSGDSDNTEEDDYDYSVDEDTTLNLPDGRVMTIGDLQKYALQGEELERRENELAQRITNFNLEYEAAKDLLEVSQLEADQIINSYTEDYLEKLYNEDRAAYADEVRYLDRLKARKQTILNQQAANRAKQEAIKAEEFKRKSEACVTILKETIPGWGNKMYEDLMNFAVTEYHEDPEEVLKWNNPSEFIRLYELMKYKKGYSKASSSLKGAKKSGKSISSGGTPANASKQALREKAERLYSQNKLSNEDAFAFLID